MADAAICDEAAAKRDVGAGEEFLGRDCGKFCVLNAVLTCVRRSTGSCECEV